MVHAQRLDGMHSRLADTWAGLGHHKGLHTPILPLHNVHSDGHSIGALLASTSPTAKLRQTDTTFSCCAYCRSSTELERRDKRAPF